MTKEQDTVRAILDLLKIYKYKPIHVRNTGNVFTDSNGNRRFGRTADGQRGAPDIIFAVLSHGVALEVKSSIGRQSLEQKEWEDGWVSPPSLGYYHVVRTVEEVQNIIENLKRKYGN